MGFEGESSAGPVMMVPVLLLPGMLAIFGWFLLHWHTNSAP